MAGFKIVLKILMFAFAAVLFQQCANQLPPGGGEIDLVPPRITSVYPSDGTLNFDENYFELEFSEYVEKRSVREAIFISPALEGSIILDWSGKSVRVEFPQELKDNTTYNITIGTDVTDFNNKNRMAEAFNFSFSTGEKLDRRIIVGRIFAEKPQGIMLFAYLNPADTINPSRSKPDYISQSGVDGRFRISGLAAGTYRIFAVQDEFRDLLFNSEQDKIGIPHTEIVLAEADSLFEGLNFFIGAVDTISPRLANAIMTDRNHIVLSFNEEIHDSSVSSKNFYLYDSTLNKKSVPVYAYRNMSKPEEIFLSLKDTLPEANNVYVFTTGVKDKRGNISQSDRSNIIVSSRPDTIKPIISRMLPQSGGQADYQNQGFSFAFNDAVDSSVVKKNITFSDTTGKRVLYNIFFTDDASFIVNITENLQPSKDYLIKFNLKDVRDAAGNGTDTTIVYRFKTISGLDFTGVSGRAEGFEFSRKPVLVLQGIDEKKITYQKNISASKFDFERIQPGSYRLWAFYDTDSSFTYSKGTHQPFIPSEEFSFYKDTLQLRPRWAITDIQYIFGK